MERTAQEQRGCLLKVPFHTKALAENAAQSMRRTMQKKGKPCTIRPYHCAFCDHWHVGNSYGPRKATG